MLIEFTVENYRSFAEAQTLSFVASKDTSHPGHIINKSKLRLLNAAAVYGSNASGKSNLLRAMKFMKEFVQISATKMNLGEPIKGLDPFRLDAAYRSKPSSFEVRLLIGETHYRYGFSADQKQVYDEWLYVRHEGGRETRTLLRKCSPETNQTEWILRGELKEQSAGVTEKTRDNGLFLSRAAEMNVEFVNDLFLWFCHHLWYYDLSITPYILMDKTAGLIQKDDQFRERVKKLILDADIGIDRIFVKGKQISNPDNLSEDALSAIIRLIKISDALDGSEESSNYIRIQTIHRIFNSNEFVEFSLDREESNGTQRFFSLIGLMLIGMDDGNLLVVDELDCSMHPLLSRKLLELFQSPEVNTKGAQIVFATHDTNLMSPNLFRRDQIWFTEKNQKGATELFPLSDIETKKARKHEAFEKNYLSGRYGGVPNFGPAFEDMEIR